MIVTEKKTEVLGKNYVEAPISPTEIPHKMTRDRTLTEISEIMAINNSRA
jgi:hypothetical protein